VLRHLAAALSPGPRLVVVDGSADADRFADLLAEAVAASGHDCARVTGEYPPGESRAAGQRTIVVANGGQLRTACPPGAVMIWLRTASTGGRDGSEHVAQVVVDMQDPAWPVVRRLDESLADRDSWYLTETQAFFAVRAATWDRKFGDDMPAYATAVADTEVPRGAVAIDVGCGTGRALPALRSAVGPTGTVLGMDVTVEMLRTAVSLGRSEDGHLVLADARRLPLAASAVDVVFAAGLLGHLPEVEPVLRELARVTATGGRLALFHPSGRAALAARHGRVLRADEPLAETPLRAALARTGWILDLYDDAVGRFFARAIRRTEAEVTVAEPLPA
jgi:ubiquinone/menaquinone biosynthesis C-methylase UbiE